MRREGAIRFGVVGIYYVLTTVSLTAWALAQQPGCTVSANVVIRFPNLSALPESQAEAIVSRWDHLVRLMTSQVPHWEWAQQGLCGILPSEGGVLMPGEEGGPDLSAQDFFAHDRKHPIPVRSIATKSGARRIVLVVEDGIRMSPTDGSIDAAVTSGVLSNPRAQDSFGLNTGGGRPIELPLGSSPQAIREAVGQMVGSLGGDSEGNGPLDAVLKAAAWLSPPEAGDAILLMAVDLEGKHRAPFSKVRAAVDAGHVRVFDVQLGGPAPTPYFDDWPNEELENLPRAGFGNVSHDTILVRSTGGLALPALWLKRAPAPDELRAISAVGERMYRAICTYYVLQLNSVGRGLVVGLEPTLQNRFPYAYVSYPRDPAPCRTP